MPDWVKMKNEYVTGRASYRDLAKIYHVSPRTLVAKAKEGKWKETREAVENATAELTLKEAVSKSQKFFDMCEALSDRIAEIIENNDKLTVADIKNLTGAIKDLQQIRGIKTERDIREQEARIEKLKKDVEDRVKEDKEIVVKVEGALEEYCG